MNQNERRMYLINTLLSESGQKDFAVPPDKGAQKKLLRSLMNLRAPASVSDKFIEIESEYLRQAIKEKGITDISDLTPLDKDIYLWQGDITTLRCDAVVNAANSQMLGCFRPCHNCIDNCIHTYAGVELRNKCSELMRAQGFEEPTGKAKITPAYNLPSKFVLHTVGPIVSGQLKEGHCELLRSCYLSCLKLAEGNGVKSIAFCCISTGVFGFPQREAAEIAVATVKEYKKATNSDIKVIFNVFKDDDLFIYRSILQK